MKFAIQTAGYTSRKAARQAVTALLGDETVLVGRHDLDPVVVEINREEDFQAVRQLLWNELRLSMRRL